MVLVTDVNFTTDFTNRPVRSNRLGSVQRSNFSETRCDLDQEKLAFERAHWAGFDDLGRRNDDGAVNGRRANRNRLNHLKNHQNLLKKANSVKIQA